MSKTKMDTLKCQRAASFEPETWDAEKRTIEVVFSTGSIGKRWSWDGPYLEELSMKKEHVMLERLNKGAPFLKNHSSYDLEDSLGVVEKAWIQNKEGRAIIRLTEREDAKGIIGDILSGILRNISVGYVVHEFEDVTKKKDEMPTYRAIKWEPMEISSVLMPFDMNSQVRSGADSKTERFETVIVKRDGEMSETGKPIVKEPGDDSDKSQAGDSADKNDPAFDVNNNLEKNPDSDENDQRAVKTSTNQVSDKVTETKEAKVDKEEIRKEEKARALEIKTMCRDAGITESEFADKMIDEDVTPDEARKMVIGEMAKRNKATKTNNQTVEASDIDQRSVRIEMASNALLHRHASDKNKIHKDAVGFRGMSLLRMAEEILVSQGVSVRGLSKDELAQRALHTTSDFVEILGNVARLTLRAGYEEIPQSFEPFTRRIQVPDFREIARVQLGDAPDLEKVNEHGEYKNGTLGNSAEKYTIDTYGKIVGVTRKVLINDDLNAFARLPEGFGRSARNLESQLIYAHLLSNPVMGDGNQLFSSAHGNVGTAAKIGVASVSQARAMMRLQKGLNNQLLSISPKTMLVPAALETEAEQFLGPIQPNTNAQINPFTGKFDILSDGRLDAVSAIAWYLLAQKSQIDMIELATLEGQDGPQMDTKNGFNVDGVQFKVSYDVGVKAIDWRGFFMNPGLA